MTVAPTVKRKTVRHYRVSLEALARPQISSESRVRNMLVIILGALVLIGVFVFLCDVTDLWNIVLNKTKKR